MNSLTLDSIKSSNIRITGVPRGGEEIPSKLNSDLKQIWQKTYRFKKISGFQK